jgi:hypothetical protein
MVSATSSRVIPCDPDTFLAFVLDPARYREVDDKIGPIEWIRADGLDTYFRFRARFRGLGPGPKTVSKMTLIPGRRVDIRYAEAPHNRLVRHLTNFTASFACEPIGPKTTKVTRTITIQLPRVLRPLEDILLGHRLQRSVDRELELASKRDW